MSIKNSSNKKMAFILVLWGEEYREKALKYCFRSLLSPGNFPSIQGMAKLIIATTKNDWHELQKNNVFKKINEYVHVEHLVIETPPYGKNDVIHMTHAHKRLFENCFENGYVGINFSPDSVFSDGSCKKLLDYCESDVDLLLAVTVRTEEEGLFSHLSNNVEGIDSLNTEYITLPSRLLVEAALMYPHIETQSWEWKSKGFSTHPSAAIWKSEDKKNAVIHCFEWLPLMIDFSSLKELNVEDFEYTTMSDTFIDTHFGPNNKIEVVADSDNIMLATWSPRSQGMTHLVKPWQLKIPFVKTLYKYLKIGNRYYNAPPLKQYLFLKRVIWHVLDKTTMHRIDMNYLTNDFIDYIFPVKNIIDNRSENKYQSVLPNIHQPIALLFYIFMQLTSLIPYAIKLLIKAGGGDKDAFSRIYRGNKKILKYMFRLSR